MLVLSRQVDEGIVITLPSGELVEVRVLGIRNGRARLGCAARREIIIDREEVHEQRRREEPAACQPH